jgi:putative hemolysin
MPHPAELHLRLATSEQDVLGAQRLRYRVFVEELGGDGTHVDHVGRFERDAFDDYADQLVLIDPLREEGQLDHVVGVYRLLRSDQIGKAGRYYSEAEYDLTPLKQCGRRLLELGRSCIAPDYRGSTALFQLWQGLGEYVTAHGCEVMFGTASFHGTDVEALSQPLSHLHHGFLAPQDLRPRALAFEPMDLIAAEDIDRPAAMKAMPALIKAYLRLGGMVGEGAFVDHAFNTVDVCLVMDTARLSAKHRALYTRARA